MSAHENNTPLTIRARGITRRVIPALQIEIGPDPADLLLQLDHWIATEGSNGNLTISARTISARAFPLWSVRKTQRVIQKLAALNLITLTHLIPGGPPTISLNLTGLGLLKTVNIRYTAAQPTPVTGDAPPTLVTHPATPVTHPPDTGDAPRDTGDAPHHIYTEEELKERTKEREREEKPPTLDSMITALAHLCVLDENLNRDRITAHAQQLAQAGYTPDDIRDLAWYWYHHDWRGKKDDPQPPFLTQIAATMRQALEHPEVIRRRALRAEGKEPDTDDEYNTILNRYLRGKYADAIDY